MKAKMCLVVEGTSQRKGQNVFKSRMSKRATIFLGVLETWDFCKVNERVSSNKEAP